MSCLLDPPLGAGDLVLSDFDGTVSVRDTGLEMITRLQLIDMFAGPVETRND